MRGLVLFLPGLGGNEHAWGAVPDFIRNSELGKDFDVAVLTYSANIRSPSDITKSARRILTDIETNYAHHDPVYLIGYSLGGLIAREVCKLLLLEGPDVLLSRIAGVLTVGTPLEGSRHFDLIVRYLPIASKLVGYVPCLSPKLSQLIDKRFVFDGYRSAIRTSISRGVSRPRQIHLQMEDDGIISSHVTNHFTEDDRAGGVIPGTHTKFASTNEDATKVANVLLQRIRERENSFGRQYTREFGPVKSVDLPQRLVLIACSHGKLAGGNDFAGPAPAGWIPDSALRQRVISKRSYVYGLLQDAQLEDGFKRGNNRSHQLSNTHLQPGPDLGGTKVIGHEGSYLPAFQRYTGKLYVPVEKTSWQHYFQSRDDLHVLIMSGLYGLIEPEEWIQDYDVHLTDSDIDTGQTVSSMWSELYTKMLQAYIASAQKNRKVRILNLLCDEQYVDAIHWHSLGSACTVLHLASPTLRDTALLPAAGTILNRVLANPETMDSLVQDTTEYDLSNFGAPPPALARAKVIFESKLGMSKQAS
jgi:pimeloyl-ACP methyl ester carboxylesterase